jgi:G3E family GTPase
VRVPLILLTGFLGAGKTTLLNALLKITKNVGVVVNELGEVGIDGALLGDAAARQIELPGGCVCCVLGDDLDRTLIDLVDHNPHLEAIVLETTGVAEPLPIAWALEREEVAKRVRLAAVVTVVDAVNFYSSRPLSAAVDAQVAYADVILVTKSQFPESQDVTSAIRTLTSEALVRIGETATHVAWLDQLLRDPPVGRESSAPTGQDHDHVHDEQCRHLDNPLERSVHGIDSVWTSVSGVVDLEELEDALGELPSNYVRIKGIVKGVDQRGHEGWYAVHRVGKRVSSEPVESPGFEAGRVVALGSQVDARTLDECVRRAIEVKTGQR